MRLAPKRSGAIAAAITGEAVTASATKK